MADQQAAPRDTGDMAILDRVDAVMAALDGAAAQDAGAEPVPAEQARGADGKFIKPQAETETAPANQPASDEGDAGEPEPVEAEATAAPAIDPPASWTAEAKTRFAKLDPDTQGYIVERETERERAVNLAKQEASNTAKSIDAEKAQIASERARYGETLKYMVDNAVLIDPVLRNGRTVDWAKLAAEDPAAYVQQWAAYQQREAQLQATQQEVARVQFHSAQQQITDAAKELAGVIPEWSDDAKWKATSAKIGEYLNEIGVPKERWAGIENRQVLNSSELRVVYDAMKWREFQKAKAAVPAKKVTEAAPKTVAPKTTTTKTSASPQVARLKNLAIDSTLSLRDRARAVNKLIDTG